MRVFQLPAVDVAMEAAGGLQPAVLVGELPGGHVALSDEQPVCVQGQEAAGGEAPPLEEDPEVPFPACHDVDGTTGAHGHDTWVVADLASKEGRRIGWAGAPPHCLLW